MNNLYSDNYEIIDDSHCANVGGDNEYTTIVKIKDKNLYSLFHYDMVTRTFYDTTNGILKGNEILLDNYFNDIGYS